MVNSFSLFTCIFVFMLFQSLSEIQNWIWNCLHCIDTTTTVFYQTYIMFKYFYINIFKININQLINIFKSNSSCLQHQTICSAIKWNNYLFFILKEYVFHKFWVSFITNLWVLVNLTLILFQYIFNHKIIKK